jgi:phage FluMu gp28-like protein
MIDDLSELQNRVLDDTGRSEDALVKHWGSSMWNIVDDIFRFRNESGALVPYTDYPYLRSFIDAGFRHPDNDRVVLKSRQIGLSTGVELESSLTGLIFDDIEVSLVSNKYDNAKKLIRACGNILRRSPYFEYLPIEEHNIRKEAIEFNNGSRIIPYSSRADSVRSENIKKAFLDEFAFVPNQKEMLDAIQPKTTRGGSICMLSTPLAIDDEFMAAFHASYTGTNGVIGPNRKLAWFLPMYAEGAIDLTKSLLEQAEVPRLCMDARLDRIEDIRLDSVERFMQEYMCVPLDDSLAYYPTSLIMACVDDLACSVRQVEALDWRHRAGVVRFGIDHALVRDETALSVLYGIGHDYYLVDCLTTRDDYEDQLALIDYYVELYHPAVMRVDISGEMGHQIDVDLSKRHKPIMDGVQYSNDRKREMAMQLKRYLQNKANSRVPCLTLPSNQDVISQLHGIKIEVTPSANIRFSGKDGGGLDDIPNSLWLAIPLIDIGSQEKAAVTYPTQHASKPIDGNATGAYFTKRSASKKRNTGHYQSRYGRKVAPRN